MLAALTLITLDLQAGQGSPLASVRRGADAVLAPAQRVTGAAARSIGAVVTGLPRVAGYQAEARRLQLDNDRLRAELAASTDTRRQVGELRQLLGLKDAGRYTMVPAYVSSRGSFLGFDNAVTLDVGERDGIRKDQTVVSARGLVGRVLRVSRASCTVALITDPGFSAGARIAGHDGLGVARGDGRRGLRYEQVEGDRVEADDVLLTSGGTLARGIPVGRVRVVRTTGTQLKTASVEPFVDVSTLDLVAVVAAGPSGQPRVPVPPRTTSRPQPAGVPGTPR